MVTLSGAEITNNGENKSINKEIEGKVSLRFKRRPRGERNQNMSFD